MSTRKNKFKKMFETKRITTDSTLGSRLEQEREALGFSIKEVSEKTHIAPQYIEALEKAQYEILPGEIYAKCFVRSYAKFLDTDPEEMVGLYLSEKKIMNNTNTAVQKDIHTPVKKASYLHFLVAPRILRSLMVVFVALVCLTYLGFKVEAIVRPPDLEVIQPLENTLLYEPFVVVEGYTQTGATLTINNQKILVEDDGRFSHKLDLSRGLNEVIIAAKRDHSKENIVIRRIVVQNEDLQVGVKIINEK